MTKIYRKLNTDDICISGNISDINLTADQFYDALQKYYTLNTSNLIIENNHSPQIRFLDNTIFHFDLITFKNCTGKLSIITNRDPISVDYSFEEDSPLLIEYKSSDPEFQVVCNVYNKLQSFFHALPNNADISLMLSRMVPIESITPANLKPLIRKPVTSFAIDNPNMRYSNIVHSLLSITQLKTIDTTFTPIQHRPVVEIINDYLKKPRSLSNIFKCKKEVEKIENNR